MTRAPHLESGEAAEDRARRFLESKGLELVARNWRCKAGELDLVMRDGEELVVAEVRSRSRSDFGSAAESILWRKRRKIVNAAKLLLAMRPELAERPVRFDVIAIDGDGPPEWLRGAFDGD